MACIYLLNSHEGPQSLDFIITTYSYPLPERVLYGGAVQWLKQAVKLRLHGSDRFSDIVTTYVLKKYLQNQCNDYNQTTGP